MNQYYYGFPQKPKTRLNYLQLSKVLALISAGLAIFLSIFGTSLFGIGRYYGRYGFTNSFLLGGVIPLIIGLIVLRVALQNPPNALRWGGIFLTSGIMSLILTRATSGVTGFTGALLIVAGIFALVSKAVNQPTGPSTLSNSVNYEVPSYAPYYPPVNSQDFSQAWNPAQPGAIATGPDFSGTGSWPPPPTTAGFVNPDEGVSVAAATSSPASPNPFYMSAFNQAAAQAQSGQKWQAHTAFKALERDNPLDVNLLLWLAFTAPNRDEAYGYVNRAALYDPASPSVAQAQIWLSQQP